ncbi:MAG: S-layer homology domain-containing protein [Candidatus Peribacteraceae bacterium]
MTHLATTLLALSLLPSFSYPSDPVERFDQYIRETQEHSDSVNALDEQRRIRDSLDKINDNLKNLTYPRVSAPSYALPPVTPIPEPRCQAEADALADLDKEIDRLMDQRWGILPAIMGRTDIIDYGAKLRIAARAEQIIDTEINRLLGSRQHIVTGQLCEQATQKSRSSARSSSARSVSSTTTPKTVNTGALPFDVASDAWYSSALSDFISNGWISASKPFRSSDVATREEFIRLIVEMNGGVLRELPSQPSFDDVPVDSPAFGWFEEAAKEGWVTGQGDCYGKHPCNAKPGDPINRAEAAALIIRPFQLTQGQSPSFEDVPAGAWYGDVIRTAASHCILQGDSSSAHVRPASNMNRAEMIVMLWRVDKGFTHPNCQ